MWNSHFHVDQSFSQLTLTKHLPHARRGDHTAWRPLRLPLGFQHEELGKGKHSNWRKINKRVKLKFSNAKCEQVWRIFESSMLSWKKLKTPFLHFPMNSLKNYLVKTQYHTEPVLALLTAFLNMRFHSREARANTL